MRTTTGAGEEATRAAGGSCTETRTAWNTPLRCRRWRQRRETTSRRGGTMKTTTDTGGVRVEGRRGRGRPCRCDAGGGGNVGRCTSGVERAAEGDIDEEEGEAGAAAAVFRRNSSDTVAWPGKRMALLCRERQRRRKPTLRQSGTGGWRWYSGGNATLHQRGRVSDGPRAKRSAGRREGTPARPRKVVAMSAAARARRHRQLEGGRRRGKRRRRRGEVVRPRGSSGRG
uniref:OSJNBa0059D20.2 protein n=1 Tax=Oryza sativa subsp. japonica TaxID=39947 RepID=Q7X6T6_ORYSJ|nr:OSJNBa0059D20.2 [Oryza sativa Japonica Group]